MLPPQGGERDDADATPVEGGRSIPRGGNNGAGQAQAPRPIKSIGKAKVVNPVILAEILRTDSDRIKAIEKSVNNLTAAVSRLETRTAGTDDKIEALTGMTARSSNGRSLINLVEDNLHKTRLICAETVPVEVLGISGHDPNCD